MSRPNFLIIFPDQQRFDHIGACRPGGDTPHIDRIAETGCTFARAYTPCPLCSPARAAMMTGRFPHAVGVPSNTSERVTGPSPAEVMVSQLLARRGYRCGYSGKWHISRGPVEPWGFAEVVGNHHHYARWCRREGVPLTVISDDSPQRFRLADAAGRLGAYSTPVPAPAPCGAGQDYDSFVAAEADRLVRRYAQQDSPFAVWCCFHGPHPPFVIPEPYYSLYSPGEIPRPANFADPPQAIERWQGAVSPIASRFLQWDWPAWQKAAAAYRGYVKLLDDAVGLLLETLRRLKLLDETVVIYTTDHGEMLGNHRLWQKMNMYEESAHIPLIVRPPGGCPRRQVEALVNLADVAPTILDFAGIEPPGNLHSSSLRPLIAGEAGDDREATFSQWNSHELRPGNLRMVRTERHKYIWYPEGKDSLYNLSADPHELTDRIDDPSCAGIVREHRARLLEWLRATDDPLSARLAGA